jgi:hypothetical protein
VEKSRSKLLIRRFVHLARAEERRRVLHRTSARCAVGQGKLIIVMASLWLEDLVEDAVAQGESSDKNAPLAGAWGRWQEKNP